MTEFLVLKLWLKLLLIKLSFDAGYVLIYVYPNGDLFLG